MAELIARVLMHRVLFRVGETGDNRNKILNLVCYSKFNETSVKNNLLKNETTPRLHIPKHFKSMQ